MIHQKDFPFHEPEDEVDIVHVDHLHHRSSIIGKIVVIAIIIAMIILSTKALFDLGRGANIAGGGTPVIEPNPEPYKATPEDPGGMEIPHIDKEIYGKIKMPIDRVGDEPIDLYAEEHFKSSPLAKMIEDENKNGQEENKKALRSTGDSGKTDIVKPEVKKPEQPRTIKIENGREVSVPSPKNSDTESPKAKRIDVDKVLAKKPENEIWLQLGSYKSEQEATKAWQDTREKNSDILRDLTIKVTKSDMKDQGVFYRLQAGSVEDEQKAKDLCVKLNARKQNCFFTTYKNVN